MTRREEKTENRTSASTILERAEALVPVLLERARDTEDQRQISKDTMARLEEAELFAAFSPPSVGGLGLGVEEYGHVVRILAHGCASTAWVYSFLVAHNVYIVQDAPHLLKGRPFAPAAAGPGIQGNPAVTATPVDGGWRVTGRWKFASGIMNAECMLLVTLQDNGADPPSVIGLIADVDQGRIDDVWEFSGLRGTGSNDFVIEEAFLAHDRQWGGILGLPEVNAPVADSNMNVSMVRLLDVGLGAIAVGIAEAATEAFKTRVLTRTIGYGQGFQRDHREAWARYADVAIRLRTVRLLWDEVSRFVTDLAQTGRASTVEEAAYARLSTPRICQLTRDVVQVIAEGSGSSVNHLDNPLQRQQRDLDTLKSHSNLHWDAASVTAGAALLGLADPVDPLVLG